MCFVMRGVLCCNRGRVIVFTTAQKASITPKTPVPTKFRQLSSLFISHLHDTEQTNTAIPDSPTWIDLEDPQNGFVARVQVRSKFFCRPLPQIFFQIL